MYYSMRYLLDIEGAGESEGTFYRIHWGVLSCGVPVVVLRQTEQEDSL